MASEGRRAWPQSTYTGFFESVVRFVGRCDVLHPSAMLRRVTNGAWAALVSGFLKIPKLPDTCELLAQSQAAPWKNRSLTTGSDAQEGSPQDRLHELPPITPQEPSYLYKEDGLQFLGPYIMPIQSQPKELLYGKLGC